MWNADSHTLKTVAASAKEPQSLVQIGLVSILVVTAGELNGATEELADEASRGGDSRVFVGNVVLQTGALIDGELDALIDGSAKTLVILAGIEVICVVLGVVDVLLGAVPRVSGDQQAEEKVWTYR